MSTFRNTFKKVALGCLFSFALPATLAQAGDFDFYVLALSWSPSYCAVEGSSANRDQCGTSRPFAFVVHGLWPQNERGYPSNCTVQDRDVPRSVSSDMLDIMPSRGLIRHQWRKHGSCSGLSQQNYFLKTREAYGRVRIPDRFKRLDAFESLSPRAVEQAFISVNPGLKADGIAISCDRRYLREVRICMTRNLQFRACEEVDQRACRARSIAMPPIRGRN